MQEVGMRKPFNAGDEHRLWACRCLLWRGLDHGAQLPDGWALSISEISGGWECSFPSGHILTLNFHALRELRRSLMSYRSRTQHHCQSSSALWSLVPVYVPMTERKDAVNEGEWGSEAVRQGLWRCSLIETLAVWAKILNWITRAPVKPNQTYVPVFPVLGRLRQADSQLTSPADVRLQAQWGTLAPK